MASEIHRLGAHAMATEFQIFITATSEAKALTAASTALRDLETLESELSRFKGNSDIHRINHLPKGQSTPVGHAAIDCINSIGLFCEFIMFRDISDLESSNGYSNA